jgi:hypothetical protein
MEQIERRASAKGTTIDVAHPPTQLTEQDVRRIVREELAAQQANRGSSKRCSW